MNASDLWWVVLLCGAARLRLDVAPPTGAGLLAGRYSETITVVLAPRT